MAVAFSVTKHAVCRPGNLIATHYGEHMVSLNITDAVDNGTIVKVGDMTALDKWNYEAASEIKATIALKDGAGMYLVVIDEVSDDKTALIYQKPLIEYESPRSLAEEAAFYNDPADGPVRGYILHALDRFWLSEEGFSGTPEVGKKITSITGGKLTVSA